MSDLPDSVCKHCGCSIYQKLNVWVHIETDSIYCELFEAEPLEEKP